MVYWFVQCILAYFTFLSIFFFFPCHLHDSESYHLKSLFVPEKLKSRWFRWVCCPEILRRFESSTENWERRYFRRRRRRRGQKWRRCSSSRTWCCQTGSAPSETRTVRPCRGSGKQAKKKDLLYLKKQNEIEQTKTKYREKITVEREEIELIYWTVTLKWNEKM